ncbi:flavin reductase family protein [Clostridium sp. SM-530-WT-3G]|uniref:flavin reductase family protein n=1 Tax=Clostridium sp. SM-530-WT-3G TaxID=2725303 RepID=UPI00145DB6DC|nr:flavin reductase family protein [Clostridium sp. SM-530-WT-3G]NME84338.1 flavin reductase family protein [Clostridium sp. SM-530-WT-3G]
MSNFREIKVNEIKNNPFEMIGTDWMLITAKRNDKVNTMTASWGGLGVIWNKNVVTVYIRPQRYTKEFIDNSDTFSITILGDDYRKELSYLGTVSGRNQDKIVNTGLTVVEDNNTPYFNEGSLVFICKKLYAQEMNKESFVTDNLVNNNYLKEDFHTMYIGEIMKVLVKED